MRARIDANMFVGQFPFRAVAGSDVDGCAARLARLGFTQAVVSPLEAIFQEDSYAAEARLAADIAQRQEFFHFKVVNPACHWWRRDLERALDDLQVQGIRLCSTYHGYKLTDPAVEPVMEFAAEHDLPVLAMCKMQDYRMHWMIHTPEVEVAEATPFVDRFGANSLILAGLHFSDMLKLAPAVADRDHVLLDTSRLKGPWKTFEKLTEALPLARLAFGSLWPINLPDCPFEQLSHASLSCEQKNEILGGNLGRLLHLGDGV